MSFKEIILPRTVLAEIYKDYLVEISKSKHDIPVFPVTQTLSKQDYLGANLQNVIVLVYYPEFEHLPEDHLALLRKILSACKLEIADVAIINTAKEKANTENIKLLEPKLILIFGECDLNRVDKGETPSYIKAKKEGTVIITSPALENFDIIHKESKELKNRLWLSLKQFFNL